MAQLVSGRQAQTQHHFPFTVSDLPLILTVSSLHIIRIAYKRRQAENKKKRLAAFNKQAGQILRNLFVDRIFFVTSQNSFWNQYYQEFKIWWGYFPLIIKFSFYACKVISADSLKYSHRAYQSASGQVDGSASYGCAVKLAKWPSTVRTVGLNTLEHRQSIRCRFTAECQHNLKPLI